MAVLSQLLVDLEICFFRVKWFLQGKKKPNKEEAKLICENVTFIYKSFERQKMAKRLYRNIQSYYPGAKVIIADDSSKPLQIKGDNLDIIQMPFNSGLSKGLNCALKRVTTPFVIRMDDDELLTPFTRFHKQLKFLMEHPEVDLVSVIYLYLPMCTDLTMVANKYLKQPITESSRQLKIPHLTKLDETHVVLEKTENVFVVRTDKLREVGYDDNIRMIDHYDFFYRAAGKVVSVLDPTAFVFHYHNHFNRYYEKFRTDIEGDRKYIWRQRKEQAEQANQEGKRE